MTFSERNYQTRRTSKASVNMEPEPTQYLKYIETIKSLAETAHKAGLLGKLSSWPPFSHNREQQADPADYREKALQIVRENAIETLAGLELTVQEALQILEPGFDLGDLDKVDSTWQKHWEERASAVGFDDSERRTWWARLLAGEIKRQGTFSLRTLAAMDTLSTEEAKLLTRICQYVWWEPLGKPVLISPPSGSDHWTPSFHESTLLENAGLIKFTPSDLNESPIYLGVDQPEGGNFVLVFDKVPFRIDMLASSQGIRCGNLVLTDVGMEMYRLTTPEYSESYRDEILAEWQRSSEVLEVVKMVGKGVGFDA